jgi:hypothetical protein
MTTPDDRAAQRARQEADRKARRDAYYDGDFSAAPNVPIEFRTPSALEYIAHQMGRIRRALEEINEREQMKFDREEAERTKEIQKDLQARTAKVKKEHG